MAAPDTVEIWVCDNCGNYYASSNAGDLSQKWNVEKNSGRRTFQRSRCPTRACADENIHRRRIVVKLPVLR